MLESRKGKQISWCISAIAGLAGILAWSCPASAAFTFTKIVDTNTPIPGGTGNFSFNGSDTPAVSGLHVVFDTGDETIWAARINGSRLRREITPGTTIPPGNLGTFQQYYGDYVQLQGNTVVLVGDNCGGCGSGVGIYTKLLGSDTINSLVDTNTFLPGSSTDKFSGFPPDFDETDTTVVFQDRQNVWAVPLAGGPVNRVATDQDNLYSPPEPFCCIFDQPSIKGSRVLMRGSNVFGRASIQQVDVSGDPFSFRFVATGTMHPPGTPRGYRFDNFDFARPVYDHGLIFYGDGTNPNKPKPYIRGIYIRDGGFRNLVDSTMPVPGGTGNFQFAWYGTLSPIAAGKGIMVFGNIDNAGSPALFAMPEAGGPITRIIGRGDPIGGFIVQDLGLRRASFDGTTLAFSVSYAGFLGSGIYATEVVLP